MPVLAQLASDDVLDSAFEWLCRRRRDYSANSDVWEFRRRWQREKVQIKDDLLSGNYRFALLSRVTLKDGDDTDLWSARDALVLKALALVLAKHLPVSCRCTHIRGNGGAKFAVREVRDHLADNRFVLRTDVKSYYASIDHLLLLDQLTVHIKDRRVLNLIGQYLRRTSERGGSFWDYERGISLGCPLSPLIGAFFLHALDAAAAKLHIFYVRFMDDILILAPTRWQLRGVGGGLCRRIDSWLCPWRRWTWWRLCPRWWRRLRAQSYEAPGITSTADARFRKPDSGPARGTVAAARHQRAGGAKPGWRCDVGALSRSPG
jgi:RNA-directed DNA polymerase